MRTIADPCLIGLALILLSVSVPTARSGRAPRSIHRMMVCFSDLGEGLALAGGNGLGHSPGRGSVPRPGGVLSVEVPDQWTGPRPTGMDVLSQTRSRRPLRSRASNAS